jgi:hypothetical protein
MPTDCGPGSCWLRGNDHQSAARPFSLPCFFDICEGNAFCLDMKFSFCGMRHHFLKGFEQNAAWWNPGRAQNC